MRENGSYKSKPLLIRPNNIVLVGLSGAGKTVIGRHLAWQMGFGLFDLDEEIEIWKKKRLQISARKKV